MIKKYVSKLKKYRLTKNSYIQYMNILFGGVSLIANIYLTILFSTTNFLVKNTDNTLIAPLITFALGVGLKSVYSYLINAVCDTPDETNNRTNDIKHSIDLMTALTYFAYISHILIDPEFDLLLQILGCATLVGFLFVFLHNIPKLIDHIRENKK